MMNLLTALIGHRGRLGTLLALLLLCTGLFSVAATPALADSASTAAELAAREAELAKKIHGARSARGMVLNDQLALESIRLKPVKLADGRYMLRAYNTATGQFIEGMSHPTLKSSLTKLHDVRFTDAASAQASAPAHKSWLTRAANELELRYRGRLGGLQTELNKVKTSTTPVETVVTETTPKPTTETTVAKPTTTVEGTAKPVVETASTAVVEGTTVPKPKVSRTRVPNGSGAPAPEALSTSTVAEVPQTGKLPTTVVEGTPVVAPGEGVSGTTKVAATETAKVAASETTAPTAPVTAEVAAVPATRLGRMKAATVGAFKDNLKMMPVMIATGIGVDLANQYRQNGSMDLMTAVGNIMTTQFLGAVGGALMGGTMGQVAGNVLSKFAGPAGPFVKVAMAIGGAALGANLGSGSEIDWKRLAFSTVLTAGAAMIPGVGPLLSIGAGLFADSIYDRLFGKKKENTQSAANTRQPNGNTRAIPVPLANGPNNPPNPVPPVQVAPPVQPPPGPVAPPPVAIKPPLPPDKNDPYGDLRYTQR